MTINVCCRAIHASFIYTLTFPSHLYKLMCFFISPIASSSHSYPSFFIYILFFPKRYVSTTIIVIVIQPILGLPHQLSVFKCPGSLRCFSSLWHPTFFQHPSALYLLTAASVSILVSHPQFFQWGVALDPCCLAFFTLWLPRFSVVNLTWTVTSGSWYSIYFVVHASSSKTAILDGSYEFLGIFLTEQFSSSQFLTGVHVSPLYIKTVLVIVLCTVTLVF